MAAAVHDGSPEWQKSDGKQRGSQKAGVLNSIFFFFFFPGTSLVLIFPPDRLCVL